MKSRVCEILECRDNCAVKTRSQRLTLQWYLMSESGVWTE